MGALMGARWYEEVPAQTASGPQNKRPHVAKNHGAPTERGAVGRVSSAVRVASDAGAPITTGAARGVAQHEVRERIPDEFRLDGIDRRGGGRDERLCASDRVAVHASDRTKEAGSSHALALRRFGEVKRVLGTRDVFSPQLQLRRLMRTG